MVTRIIQRRKSIHERNTPVRGESDHDERNEDSASRSESEEEEYVKATTHNKKTNEDHLKVNRKASLPQQIKQNTLAPVINNNRTDLKRTLLYVVLFVSILWFLRQEKEQSCSFENLKNEFPNENSKIWIQLKIGIDLILNKKTEKPGVYLLAHRNNESSGKLVLGIAEQSSKCFGKKLVSMENDDFLKDDYGYAIEKYKNKIKEGGVFIIADLNKIPARAARAFHTICDTHSPIGKNVVIFLALTIDENREGNDHTIAEETLKELWGAEVGQHELDPLITRVTDQVIVLNS